MLDVLAVQLVYAVHVWLVGINRTKVKVIVLSAAMATSTKQDRPALIVQWVNEVDHHWERALSVKKRPTQLKQGKIRARPVTLDKHPTQPKQHVKDHRTNNPPIALRIFNF